MSDLSIDQIIHELPSVNSKRNYWFVRTQGGSYYDDYIEKGIIAIGYDKIRLDEIKNLSVENYPKYLYELGATVKARYKDELKPNYIASQLIKFMHASKRGDIVLIPSYGSEKISFGEIVSTNAFKELIVPKDRYICPFQKRKRVKWYKTIRRDALDPNLYRLMYSHHTITEGNSYSPFIDKILNSFFVKDNIAHLILDVQAENKIKAKDLFAVGSLSLEIFEDFCKEEGLENSSEDIDVKINVQSPGFIEMSGSVETVIIYGIILAVLIGLAGGGFILKSSKGNLEASMTTDGIIEKIILFIKSKSNIKLKKQLFDQHAKDLKIENPKELIELINAIDGKKSVDDK
jgi:restriction system protein